eukprot:15364684-Ditylum_brightwellii.AAC.1
MLQAGNVECTLCTYQAAIAKCPNIALYHCNKAVHYKRVGKKISLEMQSMLGYLMLTMPSRVEYH